MRTRMIRQELNLRAYATDPAVFGLVIEGLGEVQLSSQQLLRLVAVEEQCVEQRGRLPFALDPFAKPAALAEWWRETVSIMLADELEQMEGAPPPKSRAGVPAK